MGIIRIAAFCLLALAGCSTTREKAPLVSYPPAPAPSMAGPAFPESSLAVTASAFNSTREQTDERPGHAAWGDSLAPGMRVIAISRDLIPMGLGQGVTVRIDGLPGEYTVLDKMGPRWRKRIDIYFGRDVAAAREWGTKKVVIRWVDTAAVHPLTGRSLTARDSAPGIKLGCNQKAGATASDC